VAIPAPVARLAFSALRRLIGLFRFGFGDRVAQAAEQLRYVHYSEVATLCSNYTKVSLLTCAKSIGY
jgi:hypothetical protein